MTAYYMIDENALPPGRWFPGDFRSTDFEDRRRIGQGKPCRGIFTVDPGSGGRALDFSLTAFGLPIATLSLADAIKKIAGDDVHMVPVRARGYGEFRFVQCLRAVDCVDEGRSIFDLFEEDAPTPAMRGEYSGFRPLIIDVSKVSVNTHMFFIERWRVRPIVSETLKEALLSSGDVGVDFVPVSS
jgi:hypothetical protein